MVDTIWGLKGEVIADIRATFADSASVYRYLGTSNKYWEPKIMGRTGVKESTASGLAKAYLRVLRDVAANVYSGKGVDLDIARDKATKYGVCNAKLEEKAIEMIEVVAAAKSDARKAAAPASDLQQSSSGLVQGRVSGKLVTTIAPQPPLSGAAEHERSDTVISVRSTPTTWTGARIWSSSQPPRTGITPPNR